MAGKNKNEKPRRDPVDVGKRIRFLREFHHKTQAEFARLVGLKSQGSVSACESGRKNYQLHLKHAHLICDHFGVTLDFIYRGNTDGLPRPMLTAWHQLTG